MKYSKKRGVVKMSEQKYKFFIAVVLMIMLISIFGVPALAIDTIKIGYIGPLTGEGAIIGEYELKGIEMAVDEVNKTSGVRGSQLELVVEDTAGTNSGAVLATLKMINRDDVVAIIGLVRSPNIMAATEYIKEAKIPVISGASALQVTRHGNPYIFTTRAHDGVVTEVAVKFALETIKAKKIGILHDTDVFGTGGLDNLKIHLEKYGVEPVSVQGYQTGTKDWTPQLLNFKRTEVDTIIGWGTNAQENAVILRQINQMGLNVKVVGSPSYGTTILLEAAGHYAEGLYAINDWSVASPEENSKEWVTTFRDRYGHDPDWASVSGYDGLRILANAIDKAGADRAKIREALADTKDFVGIQAKYTFDKYGSGNHQMVISEVKEGRFLVVGQVQASIEE
jgi:branched-chain amino acid transport system substrate-binding protein